MMWWIKALLTIGGLWVGANMVLVLSLLAHLLRERRTRPRAKTIRIDAAEMAELYAEIYYLTGSTEEAERTIARYQRRLEQC